MYNDGDFALNQYLPYTLVPFYPLFQQRGGDRVERNQDDWAVSFDCRMSPFIPG
jgi:chromosome transmission fidelity protein 18